MLRRVRVPQDVDGVVVGSTEVEVVETDVVEAGAVKKFPLMSPIPTPWPPRVRSRKLPNRSSEGL